MRALAVCWTVARVAAAVLLVGWLSLRLRRLDPATGIGLPAWLLPIGAISLIFGGVMVLWCGTLLWTFGIVPSEFVVRGPFHYVRNPMAFGAVLMMLGLGLYSRSISILLLAALLFLLMHIFVVFVEEPGLEKRFGRSYLEYKRSVNRWLPTLKISREQK